ncbi:MAG: DPP IV N-terminal domain-containing protein [Gemmatimonadaceae bacterium]
MPVTEYRDRRGRDPVRLARAVCAALLLLGVAVPAVAQSPLQPDFQRQQARANRANWTLAERFAPTALRSIIYSNGVQPRWLGESDTLWYNWRDRNGSQFYMVVPATATKRPLFNRDLLAAQLAEVSRRPVDPKNLPFTTLNFTKNHKVFRFTADSMRYEWNMATQTLKSLGRPPREVPADEERDRNVGGGRGGGGGGGGGPPGGGRGNFRNYSPDSTAFVFARSHNLFVVEVNKADTLKSDTTQVTSDGALDYSYGFRDTSESRRQLDLLSQGQGQQDDQNQDDQTDGSGGRNEMRVRANVNWSPDSKAFAVTRMDQRKVKDLFLVNVLAEPRPVLIRYKYAMPGEENVPQQEVLTFRRGEKALKALDLRKWRDQRLMDLHFPVNAEKLRLVRRDRTQRNLDLVEVDATTGATKILLSESIENASIDPQPVRYVRKGGDFLWWSERSGWAQYYIYDFNGTYKRPLTTGPWHVENIAQVDSIRGVVWLTGNGREADENVYYQHMYRVNGDGTGFTLLNPGNFTHNSTLSPSKRYFVDNYSRVDAPTKSVLRDATTGRQVMELGEMDMSRLKELGWKPPETFIVKAADGVTDIYGNIWKPFDFDSTKKYPIVANVYPGPQTESVTFPFNPANVPQQMAQLGMIVIQIGNRGGSPQRSAAYHRYGYYNLRDYALADKKTGIEQLAARHKWIDLDRVGIYGHSGGGFLTAAAMMLPPYNDFFKVGWSESGNHDNNIYNQNWSEWNHGLRIVTPSRADSARGRRTITTSSAERGAGPPTNGNAATGRNSATDGSSADSSTAMQDSVKFDIKVPTNIELAKNLKGNLALMTGDLDNNVHPGGTVRLADALIKANKRFDFYIVPGQPHGYRGSVAYTNRQMLEYFAEHLLGDYYRNDSQIGQ